MNWIKPAPKPKVAAEANARFLVAKLKRGGYMNEQHEAADRKMLAYYLGICRAS